MSHFLETNRILLRSFAAEDLDELMDLDSDPEVMRFISGGTPTSRELLHSRLENWIHMTQELPGQGFWAAQDHNNGFLGWFHLRPDVLSGDPELGYRLSQRVWGSGLATEGSLALLDHAFRRLGASRVVARTMTVNRRSRRVMEKCGMQHSRTIHSDWSTRIPGCEHGEVEYVISADEWEQGQNGTARSLGVEAP